LDHNPNFRSMSSTWCQVNSPDAWTSGTTTPEVSSKPPLKLHKTAKPQSAAGQILPPPAGVPVDSWFQLPSNPSTSTRLNWDAYVISPSAGAGAHSSAGTGAHLAAGAGAQLSAGAGAQLSAGAGVPANSWLAIPVDPLHPGLSTPETDASVHSAQRNIDIEAELSRQNLYKTELCRSWVESAMCKYGNKCQFAHGRHELRPVIRHPKYKTEICKTFHTNGTCPYGKRCRFVHNTAELRVPGEDETAELREIEERITQLRLGLLAPDPVYPPAAEGDRSEEVEPTTAPAASTVAKKTGSRLPFFQKLRKQKT